MSQVLISLINGLATAIGGDMKVVAAKAELALTQEGSLASLTTTEKTTLVGAINELKTGLTAVTSTAIDAPTVQGMIDTSVTQLIDGAPEALNTLNEIAQRLSTDQTALDGILISLAKRVRVDAPQSFDDTEKAQGRANLDAQSATEIGDVQTADFVATFNAARA